MMFRMSFKNNPSLPSSTSSLRIPCLDVDELQCPNGAGRGECQKNPQQRMLIQCRKSCYSCIALDNTQIAPTLPHEVFQQLIETQEYQRQQAERMVDTLRTCINHHKQCTHWTLKGECATNPGFMHAECPAACRACDVLPRQAS